MHGTGAIRHKLNPLGKLGEYRVAGAAAPFDWNTGVDVLQRAGIQPVIKDQDGSSSCGGQAFSYYMEVLNAIATKQYTPLSARDPYSHVFVAGGGSSAPALTKRLNTAGIARESDAVSYENGRPPSEAFMETIPTLTNNAVAFQEVTKAVVPITITNVDIDSIASAIDQYNGVVIGIEGSNNGTWDGIYPQINPQAHFNGPWSSSNSQGYWDHWMYFYAAKLVNGKKELHALQSWGKNVGQNGVQKFTENWFIPQYIWHVQALSFDYQAPAHKQLMVALVQKMEAVIPLYKELINKKS